MSIPQSLARPTIKLTFDLGQFAGHDFGNLFRRFEFKGMLNGGYIIKAELFDAGFNLLSSLAAAESGYFHRSRLEPIVVTFQILSGPDGEYPNTATRPQKAILIALHGNGGPADKANLEFVAIDPPSWYLNKGLASGSAWHGRLDQVVTDVIATYAPQVELDIDHTLDSPQNIWYMMRQDPMTFISSLLEWSSALTPRRTHWLVQPDGYRLRIKEQASLPSQQRAYYRYLSGTTQDTIHRWELMANNALSLVEAQLITQGLSAVSGQYLDAITAAQAVSVTDDNTCNKQIANIADWQGFTRPEFSRSRPTGTTSIQSIPEIYSGGELGLAYGDYIGGRARTLWLNLVNALMRVKFQVLGHGEWSDCLGLGVDTIFIRWTQAPGATDGFNARLYHWMTGNWLVYGFHHIVTRGNWYTDLYAARADYNACAARTGSTGFNSLQPVAV